MVKIKASIVKTVHKKALSLCFLATVLSDLDL